MLAKINFIVLLDMSNPAPQKRKRAYRHRFKCSECKKEIVVEYQDARAKTKHIRKKVKFTTSHAQINRNWASLAAMKQSPIWLNAAVNVGSYLQNDSSTDIVVDSSDTALDK